MKRITWLMLVVLVGCCAVVPGLDREEGVSGEIYILAVDSLYAVPWEGEIWEVDTLDLSFAKIRDTAWSGWITTFDTVWGTGSVVDVEPTYEEPRACHLVIFYVDTIAYKETEELVPISCPEGRPGCCVMHYGVIKRWEPVLDTIIMFSFPLEPRECGRRFSPMWKIMVE